jgi:hypothetical protein
MLYLTAALGSAGPLEVLWILLTTARVIDLSWAWFYGTSTSLLSPARRLAWWAALVLGRVH